MRSAACDGGNLPRHPERPAHAQAAQPVAVQRGAEPVQHAADARRRVIRPPVHREPRARPARRRDVLGGTDEPLGLNDWGLQPTLAGFVRFGFTPYEALLRVTALPAEVMGLESELGTVEPGK